MKNKRYFYSLVAFFSLIFVVFLVTWYQNKFAFVKEGSLQLSSLSDTKGSYYQKHIQKIFDQRCVVCHSCNNAPCQLNLTSYEGFTRGMTKAILYDGARLKSVPPTRLSIDHETEQDWRQAGFFSVKHEADPFSGVLYQTLLRKENSLQEVDNQIFDKTDVLESHSCPLPEETPKFYQERPHAGMPYNLPALDEKEYSTIMSWLNKGASGPQNVEPILSANEKKSLHEWEEFLNESSNENKIVSRYLYEHLFLAHIHFSEKPETYYRLVRSYTACAKGVREIASRRPTDDVGAQFYYCYKPILQTIVEKTHLPYLMDQQKLAWTKKNFFATKWRVEHLPNYAQDRSANPFLTFESIPVEARYRFLLEDAQYHIATFIKGPVCNGNAAVNSIDDQFYVFFMDPQADLLIRDEKFHQASKQLLVVPAEQGSDGKVIDAVKYFKRYPPLRNRYRKVREAALAQNFSDGMGLENLWDGDGKNPNAILTVFRHSDNSTVLQGARGDASRSAFVLDYALFERLVYNLVVGFDVYGNLTHQLHTRVYMGMIRMEGESNFLDFFPASYRSAIRNDWYKSRLGKIEKSIIDENIPTDHPSKIDLPADLTPAQAKAQMYEIFMQKRLSYMISLFPDRINWKSYSMTKETNPLLNTTPKESQLRMLASVPAKSFALWVNHFPDSSLIVLKSGSEISKIYTVIKNKDMKTVGSLLFEDHMRQTQYDNLTILEGLATSYPNYFFVIQEDQFYLFMQKMLRVDDDASWEELKDKWGLNRRSDFFWKESDQIQAFIRQKYGINGGILDYTHYDLWTD